MTVDREADGCWRGIVGIVQPGVRPGGIEPLIRLLPDGIGVIPLHLAAGASPPEADVRLTAYQQQLAILAQHEPDAIFVADGALFQLGLRQEQQLLATWRTQVGRPVFSDGSAQLNAMRALGIRRIVGVSWGAPGMNEGLAAYFTDAGVTPLEIATVGAPHASDRSPGAVYRRVKAILSRHERAEGLCLAGAGGHTLEVAVAMEMDFGLPVIHPVCAQSWEIQRRLRVRQPRPDRGLLLRELPRLPEHATSRVRPAA